MPAGEKIIERDTSLDSRTGPSHRVEVFTPKSSGFENPENAELTDYLVSAGLLFRPHATLKNSSDFILNDYHHDFLESISTELSSIDIELSVSNYLFETIRDKCEMDETQYEMLLNYLRFYDMIDDRGVIGKVHLPLVFDLFYSYQMSIQSVYELIETYITLHPNAYWQRVQYKSRKYLLPVGVETSFTDNNLEQGDDLAQDLPEHLLAELWRLGLVAKRDSSETDTNELVDWGKGYIGVKVYRKLYQDLLIAQTQINEIVDQIRELEEKSQEFAMLQFELTTKAELYEELFSKLMMTQSYSTEKNFGEMVMKALEDRAFDQDDFGDYERATLTETAAAARSIPGKTRLESLIDKGSGVLPLALKTYIVAVAKRVEAEYAAVINSADSSVIEHELKILGARISIIEMTIDQRVTIDVNDRQKSLLMELDDLSRQQMQLIEETISYDTALIDPEKKAADIRIATQDILDVVEVDKFANLTQKEINILVEVLTSDMSAVREGEVRRFTQSDLGQMRNVITRQKVKPHTQELIALCVINATLDTESIRTMVRRFNPGAVDVQMALVDLVARGYNPAA